MSHRRTAPAPTMLRRLLRVPLRLKVMAGVVVVTLVALAAFDIGAVTTMRRYLLGQTDSNLQGALTLTAPRLGALLSGGIHRGRPAGSQVAPAQFRPSASATVPALPGAFDMVFLPLRGAEVTLQVATNSAPARPRGPCRPPPQRPPSSPGRIPSPVREGRYCSASGRFASPADPSSLEPAWTRSRRLSIRSSSSSRSARSPSCF